MVVPLHQRTLHYQGSLENYKLFLDITAYSVNESDINIRHGTHHYPLSGISSPPHYNYNTPILSAP